MRKLIPAGRRKAALKESVCFCANFSLAAGRAKQPFEVNSQKLQKGIKRVISNISRTRRLCLRIRKTVADGEKSATPPCQRDHCSKRRELIQAKKGTTGVRFQSARERARKGKLWN